MGLRSTVAAALLAAVAWSAAGIAQDADGGSLARFSGSWRGTGSLILDDGKKERVRCRLNVQVSESGASATQTMRCASAARDVMLTSQLQAKDKDVSGVWKDAGSGTMGRIGGRLSESTLTLRMSGEDVDALLTAITSESQQRVTVSGVLGPIRKLTVAMRK